MVRLQRFDPASLNGRNRRILPVGASPGEGHLAEPIADVQPARRGPLFMPQSGPLLVGVFGLRRRCGSGRSSGRPVRGDDLFCAPMCRMGAYLADITGSAKVQAA